MGYKESLEIAGKSGTNLIQNSVQNSLFYSDLDYMHMNQIHL